MKTVEVRLFRSRAHVADVVVRICRDPEAEQPFFAIVFRRAACRVRPSFVSTVADEELDVLDPAFRRTKFARRSVQAVLADVTRALAGQSRGARLHCSELVRTIEIGPYDCAGESPWHFIVKIYKDFEKGNAFYPVVFRREMYRMQGRAGRAFSNEQVDILERTFESESFRRTSARGAASAIVRHIRRKFEPDGWGRRAA